MLRNTFVHLPGVGDTTERRFWERDWHTWEDLLGVPERALPSRLRSPAGRAQIEESVVRYAAGEWRHFEQCLPAGAKWRAFHPLRERTLYVDIETDGYDNNITVIGIYDGASFRAYVEGENLDDAREDLESASAIVTYNGTGFDMPIIRARFPYNLFNHVHIDLMWPLRRLGFRGGLKRIEQEMGIERSAETRAMSGWDAVYLWREHVRGSREARTRLLKYNEEDVRNLAPLMGWVYDTMQKRIGLTLRPG